MSVLCWSRARQISGWIICIFLLSMCPSYGVISHQASDPPKEPISGSIRLVDGTEHSGRVEMFYEGEWGTICNDGDWSNKEADVVCRSLGFGNGVPHHVPGGSGHIYLAGVNCTGNEVSVVKCNHNFEPHECTHESDAGVICEGVLNFDIKSTSVDDCTFAHGYCGYTYNKANYYKWVRLSGPTPSSDTGPSSDHTPGNTTGYYMYTEASKGTAGNKTRLSSSFSTRWINSFTFWYHMYGNNMGTLNVILERNRIEKNVWTKTGNQGNFWQYACIPVQSTVQRIIFEGIRGSGYRGDIAIDDIYFINKGCSAIESATCKFQNGMCGYQTLRGNDSSTSWSLTSGPSPIYDHSTNSSSGRYLSVYVSSPREGMKSYLISQPFEASDKMKVEFYYYMAGDTPGELQVSFKDKSTPLDVWNKNDWQDYGDHGNRWNYGCMDLYPEPKQGGNATSKILVFTSITGMLPGIHLALDDIKISNGSCGMGIDGHICTFENPKLCDYKINCTAQQEYTWRRMQGYTSTPRTGPNTDASKQKDGYYLYAESSYGKVGDAVSITFPVNNTMGKYLKFNYHMYGRSMGSLHLRYSSDQSSQEVWRICGNQGNSWKSFCKKVDNELDTVMLVAVRGYTYTSDIAVDNVFLDSKPCPNSVNCDFENLMCNYTISSSYKYYKWYMKNGTDHTYGSGHYVMASSPLGMEGFSTSIITPVIIQSSNTSSLQFYYKVSGTESGKLMGQFDHQGTVNMMEAKLFNMDVEGWVMGCMGLPANEQVSVNLTAVSGPKHKGAIMVDDISYNESPCLVGIVNNTCTFDEPNVCGYNVSCREASRFLWKRGRKTNSSATGPSSDHSKNGNGYFMYTESSFGSPGDTTELNFPQFVTPPGHYLRFYYNMYGRDIGTLQVNIITPSGKILKWYEKGDTGKNWMKGCVNLPVNESTTVVFTGIRGNGPLGDIAIDDVAVVPGVCHERSIACDFNDEMVCGYRNVSTHSSYGWVRVKSISGYYMTVTPQGEKHGLKSPLGNLTDNCIQISYRIEEIVEMRCQLDVYTSHNNKKQLSLQTFKDTTFQKAQFYIKHAVTQLIFEANPMKTLFSPCTIQIEKIEISNGTCPALVCPRNSTSCRDQTQCIENSLVCNRVQNCNDSSDESNCPQSISCDFEDPYICGYKFSRGWYNVQLNDPGKLNNSFSVMFLNSGIASLMSPKETIRQSCLQFNYAGGNSSSLEVRAHYSDGRHSSKWKLDFAFRTQLTIGQFELAAGIVYIEFAGKVSNVGLVIDNVTLQNGACGRIACPNASFTCVSNEKCLFQQSRCNRIGDCSDNSDEANCPNSLACDVENPYQCGYQYDPNTWTVQSGITRRYPDLDNSPGLYSGHYFASSFFDASKSQHKLYAPEETLSVDACLTFYYSFHGSGEFEIFDNGKSMLKIKPNNINTWQKSQIQLSQGKHNVTFSHNRGKDFDSRQYNILALDSIGISNGTCGLFVCEKGWRKCSQSPICVPKFKFCDHDMDCPANEDENNCLTYSNVRLVDGRNVHQGFVEIFYNGQWNKTCGSWYERNAAVVCRELGYNGTARTTFKTKRLEFASGALRSVSCQGHEASISNCSISTCLSSCICYMPAAVDCSNTSCESTHVPCADYNTTNSNSSATNMTRCIPKETVCDGEQDCPGGTDEQNCPKCQSNEFQCLNYQCIPKTQRCDGINHCKDGSDEYHCFKHDNLALSFMINGQYTPVCEDNLKDQDIANKLCHYVGKGNASVGSSDIKTTGVKFSYSGEAKQFILPGFTPSLAECTALSLKCSRRECGTRSPNLFEPLIRHGLEANAGEFPWQISLHYDSKFLCGGTLIDNRYVLTAAHCVRGSTNVSRYMVFVGSTLRYGGQRHTINKIMVHKNYTTSHFRNDVAVLELMYPVQISDYVRPACLPSKPWVPHTQCFITGWGKLEDNTSPNNLMETKVSLLTREVCRRHYKGSDETTLCANHRQPNQPGCFGDSGGPLVCRNEQGYWEVIGVASFGKSQCAGPVSSPLGLADVYTSRNWILSKMSF